MSRRSAAGAGLSPLTLNRLSLYLRCLRDLAERGVDTISSRDLANRYHLSATQIRKDLAQLGELGIRGVGYDVAQLHRRLSERLGLDRTHTLAVVGVGNLGQALVRFLSFRDESFRVVAAFDNDPAKIGTRVGGVAVRDSTELADALRRTEVEIAVLAVPAEAAQANYDALVAAGVRAVLNFAPTRLETHPEVPTKDVDLRIFLEELGSQLGARRDGDPLRLGRDRPPA